MNERELDRAIDVAAGSLMAREPSLALGYHVMARVRGSTAPKPWQFGWMAVSATIVLSAAMTTVMMDQAPVPSIRVPLAAKLAIADAAVLPAVPTGVVREIRLPRVVIARIQREDVSALVLPPDDASTIEPIVTEPIALLTIEVPQLERESTSIESISVEPITIEPLSASND
jgi:hypothetical protein